MTRQELVKALQYDRGQYQKGYADAMAVIDDIKAEIEAYQSDAFYSDNVMINKKMVLEIIDKYRGEADCHECKVEHDCYECEKYKESESEE